MRNQPAGRDRGQAAVEFALALPLVIMLVLGIVQLVVVCRDQLALELAAREAARAAVVSADPAAAAERAAQAATRIRPITVVTTVGAERVTVVVSSINDTDVALIGVAVGDMALEATATMQREPP